MLRNSPPPSATSAGVSRSASPAAAAPADAGAPGDKAFRPAPASACREGREEGIREAWKSGGDSTMICASSGAAPSSAAANLPLTSSTPASTALPRRPLSPLALRASSASAPCPTARADCWSRARSSLSTHVHTKCWRSVLRTSGSDSKLRSTRPVPAPACVCAKGRSKGTPGRQLQASTLTTESVSTEHFGCFAGKDERTCTGIRCDRREWVCGYDRQTPQQDASSRAPHSTTAKSCFPTAAASRNALW